MTILTHTAPTPSAPGGEARLDLPGGGTLVAEIFRDPDDATAPPVMALYSAGNFENDLDLTAVERVLAELPRFTLQLRDLRNRLAVELAVIR